MGTSTRQDWIDVAKGFCVCFVVIGHVNGWFSLFFLQQKETMTGYLVELFNALRMPLFFFISGYLASRSYAGTLRDISSKTLGLFAIYVFWESLLTIRAAMAGREHLDGWSAVEIIAFPGILWFIWALPAYYGLAWSNRKVLQHRERLILLPLFVISLFAHQITVIINSATGFNTPTLESTLAFAVWFFAGIYFKDLWNTILARANYAKMVASFAAFVALSALSMYFGLNSLSRTLLAPLALFAACQILAHVNTSSRPALVFKSIGRDTLPIYILHLSLGPTLMKTLASVVVLREVVNTYPVAQEIFPLAITIILIISFRIISKVVAQTPAKWLFKPVDLRRPKSIGSNNVAPKPV